jgi:hypothetical protein
MIIEINQVIAKYDGGYARLVRYTDGMQLLRIEIGTEFKRCAIICHGCQHISSPVAWTDAILRLTQVSEEVVSLHDAAQAVAIRCWKVSYETWEEEAEE